METEENNNKDKASWGEIIRFALITLIIVVPIRAYVAQPFIVNGASMSPTFENGHYLIVDEISYFFRQPERGEVVIFRYPKEPNKFFIKRVIGLPGETVIIEEGQTFIETKEGILELEESYAIGKNYLKQSLETTLKAGEYFVMGDNRDYSLDSRIWGPVDYKLIKGRAFLRLFPFNQMGFKPGHLENL